jgi:hypothetical protein
MGRPGETPILQLGGVQEAVSVAPPRLLRAVALLACRGVGGGAEGRNFRIGRAPGEGRFRQREVIARGDAVQGIDGTAALTGMLPPLST